MERKMLHRKILLKH